MTLNPHTKPQQHYLLNHFVVVVYLKGIHINCISVIINVCSRLLTFLKIILMLNRPCQEWSISCILSVFMWNNWLFFSTGDAVWLWINENEKWLMKQKFWPPLRKATCLSGWINDRCRPVVKLRRQTWWPRCWRPERWRLARLLRSLIKFRCLWDRSLMPCVD